jgi:hypothetical protein
MKSGGKLSMVVGEDSPENLAISGNFTRLLLVPRILDTVRVI